MGRKTESTARTAQMITRSGTANSESVLGESTAEAQSPRGAAASDPIAQALSAACPA